jgi:hypothetical protein
MSLQATKETSEKKDYGRIENGTYPARAVQIIDMGEQWSENWKTGEKEYWDEEETKPKIQKKCFIQFEFPTETMEIDGEQKPRWQGKEFVISTHEKAALVNLAKAAGISEPENGFSVADILDKPVLITIGTTSGGNAKVQTISGVPKGMDVPELYNPTVVFDLDAPDPKVFERLPSFIKEKLNNRENQKPAPVISEGDDFDEDIPF